MFNLNSYLESIDSFFKGCSDHMDMEIFVLVFVVLLLVLLQASWISSYTEKYEVSSRWSFLLSILLPIIAPIIYYCIIIQRRKTIIAKIVQQAKDELPQEEEKDEEKEPLRFGYEYFFELYENNQNFDMWLSLDNNTSVESLGIVEVNKDYLAIKMLNPSTDREEVVRVKYERIVSCKL